MKSKAPKKTSSKLNSTTVATQAGRPRRPRRKAPKARAAPAAVKSSAKGSKDVRKTKKDIVPRSCLCGCGATVKGSFSMGHDARVKSWLRAALGDDVFAREFKALGSVAAVAAKHHALVKAPPANPSNKG